jgi:hypothetical protein
MFAAAEVINFVNWPKGVFNHLTAVLSAAVMSGAVYGGSKLKEKYDGATPEGKRKIIVASVAGTMATALAGYLAYRNGIFGIGGSRQPKSGGYLEDAIPRKGSRGGNGTTASSTIPGSNGGGNTSSTASSSIPTGNGGNTASSTIPTGNGSGSTVSSSIPTGNGGNTASSTIPTGNGSNTPSTTIPVGGNNGGSGSDKAEAAQRALDKAIKAQKELAKKRAEQLGLKLSDREAQRLAEGSAKRFFGSGGARGAEFLKYAAGPSSSKQRLFDEAVRKAAGA